LTGILFCWKLTERQASGIKLWKLYFQIRACCALTSAFDKIAVKKLQANAFFCSQMLFLQANIKKNSQQQESFKLRISRRWWPEEEQPIPHKTCKRAVHESKSN
jgi:hypothetical protein